MIRHDHTGVVTHSTEVPLEDFRPDEVNSGLAQLGTSRINRSRQRLRL